MASVEASKMLAVAAAACDEKKAEDIRILALDPAESGLSDYFLICTGTNDRQTVAITDEIELRLKREFGTYPNAVEGRRQGEWILMDYVDFIVHVFLPEKRAFYGLERLRPSATTLSVAELNAEIKAAIRAERAPKKAKGGQPAPEAVDAQDAAQDEATTADRSSPDARPAPAATSSKRQTKARPVSGAATPQENGESSPPSIKGKGSKTAGRKASASGRPAAKAASTARPATKKAAKKAVSAKALGTRAAARASAAGSRKSAPRKRSGSAE